MTLRLCFLITAVLFAHAGISQNPTARPAIRWQKCLGGSGDDKASDVLLTTDGGMILAGTSASSDGDVTGNHGGYDGWVVKLNAAGAIQWQRSAGGSSNDGFNSIIKISDGGYLCVGYTSSNDGDVSGLHSPGNVYRRDCWVVKLSDSGTVVWSKVYGGSHDDVANSVLEISDGNYAVIGTALSNNGDIHATDSFEYNKGWVFKISTTGNLIWEKSFGEDEPYATGGGFGYNIIETDNHELLAYISGNRDYDSVVITPSDNVPDEWDTTVYPRIYSSPGILYKLAISNGASSYFDQTKGDGCFSMMKAAHGLYFSYLHYSFKIAPGYVNGYCMDETSEIAYRDNSTGNLEAVRTYLERCEDIGSTLFSRFSPASMHGTDQLADGQILQAGTQSGQSNCGGATGDGTLRFAGINGYYYGGSSDDVFNAVRGFPNGYEMVCAGYTRSVDRDLLGLRGDPQLECMGTLDDDFWVLKLSIISNSISGNVFLDENNNNIKDPNEHAFSKAMVKTNKSGTDISAGITNGHYEVLTDTGTLTTKLHLYNPVFYDASPVTKTTVFAVNNTADTINFAVHKLADFKDYAVSLFSAGSTVRPGFAVTYIIKCVNNGTGVFSNQAITLVKDNHLQFQNASVAPATINGDTLLWNISQLQPDSVISITVNMIADNIPLINLNDTLYSSVSMDTTADYTAADNTFGLHQRVTGSFDPNDKQESHGGVITRLEVQRGNYLNYTIRFQNTGNDTAFNIIIRDSLDEKLLPGDFEMLDCSHPYSFKITKGKYITWELPHINLVDSFHNEPASHGYISYRIKPKLNIAAGDHINNNAFIYFDFNLPVETNTTITTVSRTVAVWTGKVNTDWVNKENWDINEVPDGETAVIIPANVPHSPEVSSNAECFSIQVNPAASIIINAGYNLQINGK